MIEIVVQPEAEVNKKIDFYIYFDSLPDKGTLKIDSISGLELTDELSAVEGKIQKEADKYSFYAYATPTKIGVLNFPKITMKVRGTTHSSAPFSINVVENLKVTDDSVKLILSSDKKIYGLKDTIKIELNEYSKLANIRKKPAANSLPKLDGKENEIRITRNLTLDEISGIPDFETYLDENFEIIDFDFNPFNEGKTIEKIGSDSYIKISLLTLTLLPKKRGDFKIEQSRFEYQAFSNSDDYFSSRVAQNDGSYKITEGNSTGIKVISNALKITVK